MHDRNHHVASSYCSHDPILHLVNVENSRCFDTVNRMTMYQCCYAYQLCHCQVHCAAKLYHNLSAIMAIQSYAQQPLTRHTNVRCLFQIKKKNTTDYCFKINTRHIFSFKLINAINKAVQTNVL